MLTGVGDVGVAAGEATAVGVAGAGVAVGAGGEEDGVAVAGGVGGGVAVASSPQPRVNRVRINNKPKGMNSVQFFNHSNFILHLFTFDL